MAPNLVEFADHKQKLPKEFLGHPKPQIPVKTILSSYALDFGMIYTVYFFMAFLLTASMKVQMITPNMRTLLNQGKTSPILLFILGTTFVSYFFFSYFFNQGQTWGMMKMKTRISMGTLSFKPALYWTIFSVITIFTGALILKKALAYMQAAQLGSIDIHDHLYQNFVALKEMPAPMMMELVEEIPEIPAQCLEEIAA